MVQGCEVWMGDTLPVPIHMDSRWHSISSAGGECGMGGALQQHAILLRWCLLQCAVVSLLQCACVLGLRWGAAWRRFGGPTAVLAAPQRAW